MKAFITLDNKDVLVNIPLYDGPRIGDARFRIEPGQKMGKLTYEELKKDAPKEIEL